MFIQRDQLVATLSLAAMLLFIPRLSLAVAQEKSPSITVFGSAVVSAEPDIAQLRIGVVTHHASASRALSMNKEAMSKLLKALQEHGVSKRDLQTSSLTLSPQYHHGTRGRIPDISGYNATNLLQVKVRKLDTIGALLDNAVRTGVNRIEGVTFSVDDPATLKDKARRDAVTDARHKATLYAEAADVKLGKVLAVQEMPGAVPFPKQMSAVALTSTPVEPGDIEFRVNVMVTYAIE